MYYLFFKYYFKLLFKLLKSKFHKSTRVSTKWLNLLRMKRNEFCAIYFCAICAKKKLSRLLLDNLFRILVQKLPALEELNSKKRTPSPTVWFLWNCGIAQNVSCRIAQNLRFAKTVKGNFARNDFCEWFRKLLFFTQNWCAKKEKFCVLFRKNCATVLRMETLIKTTEFFQYFFLCYLLY